MGLTGNIVVYVVVWWLVFFMTLPFGVRGQWEDGEVVEGSEPGAPIKTNLGKKALITTGIAFVIWGLIWLAVTFNILGVETAPTWD